MAVRIRMKKMGRTHRPYFRICAVDGRRPRDGRVLEELGSYDPMLRDVDARAQLNGERINYWLGVGAQPSDNVRVLIKKYGVDGTHKEAQAEALAKLASPKAMPELGEPTYVRVEKKKEEPAAEKAPEAEAAATEEAPAEAVSEEAAAEAPAAEEAATEAAPAEAEAAPAEATEEKKSE